MFKSPSKKTFFSLWLLVAIISLIFLYFKNPEPATTQILVGIVFVTAFCALCSWLVCRWLERMSLLAEIGGRFNSNQESKANREPSNH